MKTLAIILLVPLLVSCGRSIERSSVEPAPQNLLEACILSGSKGLVSDKEISKVVANSELFVRPLNIEPDIDGKYSFLTVEEGRNAYVIAFSSKERMVDAIGDGPYIGITGRGLFSSVGRSGVYINYGSSTSIKWASESSKKVVISAVDGAMPTCTY